MVRGERAPDPQRRLDPHRIRYHPATSLEAIVWDERYDTEAYVYGREPNSFLVENSELVPDGRVLCLAEGEGRNAVFLACLGYEVVAVDSSAVGLEIEHGLELIRPIHEGELHNGDSAVVQVIARKPR